MGINTEKVNRSHRQFAIKTQKRIFLMAVSGLTRRGSFNILRSVNNRRNSCPNLSQTVPRITRTSNHVSSRNLNLMVMNPRGPKIRHLNASNPLLIELEENVQKVQELEYKVLELEKQLQVKELLRKQQESAEKVKEMKTKAETLARTTTAKHQTSPISEEEEIAFRTRLEEAKKKAEMMSMKRNEEEAEIMRSYQQNKLMLTINQLSKISEEDGMKLLDKPAAVNENVALFSDIEALVDLVHHMPDRSALDEEFLKLQEMLTERDSLVKLFSEIQEKYEQTLLTITSVNAVKIKLHANLNMSTSVLKVMQSLESRRKNQNIFVFGPNPIFNSAKEMEMDYSINNQYVIEMLKELDMTSLVAENNLKSAKECKRKYKASCTQVGESLQTLQESIDIQTNKISNIQSLIDRPLKPGTKPEESSSLQPQNINTQEI